MEEGCVVFCGSHPQSIFDGLSKVGENVAVARANWALSADDAGQQYDARLPGSTSASVEEVHVLFPASFAIRPCCAPIAYGAFY